MVGSPDQHVQSQLGSRHAHQATHLVETVPAGHWWLRTPHPCLAWSCGWQAGLQPELQAQPQPLVSPTDHPAPGSSPAQGPLAQAQAGLPNPIETGQVAIAKPHTLPQLFPDVPLACLFHPTQTGCDVRDPLSTSASPGLRPAWPPFPPSMQPGPLPSPAIPVSVLTVLIHSGRKVAGLDTCCGLLSPGLCVLTPAT